MEKINYVYITTNLINGKQYVGDHSTNNLDDGYLGSGRPYFQRAVKKYGKENFKRDIIKICESKEEAFELQEKYIKEFNTLIPSGYNISPKGGHNVKGCCSEESKEKMRKPRSKETKEKMRKPKSLSHRKNIRKANLGKSLSEETKKKISNSHLGLNHNKETKEKMRISHTGKKHSKETIEKMKGKIPWNKGLKTSIN